MKRFIIQILYFFFPVIIIVLSMEILLRNIPNDYLNKKAYLDKNASKVETLILGSSHAYYGVDPTYFSKPAFNGSHISQSLNYDLEILLKFEKELKSLKTIVLPVSYFSLFVKLEESPEAWRVKNYSIYYELDNSKSILNHSEMFINRIDVNVKRLISFYIKGKKNAHASKLGWGTNYKSDEAQDLVKTGKSAAERHVRDVKEFKGIYDDNVATINQLLDWCEARNVKLMLFTPPASKAYRRHLEKEQLNLTTQTVVQLGNAHPHCEYLNLLEDDRFSDGDFFDADHLSEIGAEKLSNILNYKIEKRD